MNSPLRRLSNKSTHNNSSRKLEHDFIAGLDKRKYDDNMLRRRLRSNDKSFSSSSSSSEPEDETELKTLLAQSKPRLENTDALRIRHHLLRPEDYVRFENFSINCARDGMTEKSENVFEFVNKEKVSETCNLEFSSSSDTRVTISKCLSERSFSFNHFEQNQIVFALNLFGFVAYLVEFLSDFLN